MYFLFHLTNLRKWFLIAWKIIQAAWLHKQVSFHITFIQKNCSNFVKMYSASKPHSICLVLCLLYFYQQNRLVTEAFIIKITMNYLNIYTSAINTKHRLNITLNRKQKKHWKGKKKNLIKCKITWEIQRKTTRNTKTKNQREKNRKTKKIAE